VEFTFAHLSDVHLGPLPKGAVWRDFAPKRVIGGLSWALRRRQLHDPAVAQALLDDIRGEKPDHIAFTGDLVNISAIAEFTRGADWLRGLGDPQLVSFTPGNHDSYVKVPYGLGLQQFEPYMTGDMAPPSLGHQGSFPYVRLRRNMAFIGLNSACPQTLLRAGGTLGKVQLDGLAAALKSLRDRGFYRAVLLHHPPLPGLAPPRKALTDAADLQAILQSEGADIVLHGHNHRRMFNTLTTQSGTVPVHGVTSASSNGHGGHQVAEWHRYSVSRQKGTWRTKVRVRSYVPSKRSFETSLEFDLPVSLPAV
jgi:3',5'-cyclic AMP phosphodiesterase CpdA